MGRKLDIHEAYQHRRKWCPYRERQGAEGLEHFGTNIIGDLALARRQLSNIISYILTCPRVICDDFISLIDETDKAFELVS